ncbi:Gfo/Idh/MocA family protein [Thermodesulfobacteriota bacterium]
MMHKAVIIGCGKVAGYYDTGEFKYVHSHASAYDETKSIEILCCVDINIDNAKRLANKYNAVDVEKDIIKALNEHKPNVVSVCTPDETHYEIISMILHNDFVPEVILLEKPVCSNMNELDDMISLSQKRNVCIIPNHTGRFDSKYQYIKKLIAKNFFGNLVRGDIFYYSGWKHNGLHVVDILNFIFDTAVAIKTVVRKMPSPYPGDPTLDIVLNIKNDNADIYLQSIDENYYQLFEFDLKFEKARLRIEDFGNRISFEKKTVNEMQENVLVLDKLVFPKTDSSPIQNLIKLISDYLTTKDEKLLEGYRISDIADTMKTIWEGASLSGSS